MTEKEFTSEWIAKLQKDRLLDFPDEFITDGNIEVFDLPSQNILMGEELFGSFELIDTDGNSVIVTDSHSKAKYILYGNREKPQKIKIPLNEQKITEAVKLYEKHLDSLIREIEKDYNTRFPKSKDFFAVSNNIFNSLNLKRY